MLAALLCYNKFADEFVGLCVPIRGSFPHSPFLDSPQSQATSSFSLVLSFSILLLLYLTTHVYSKHRQMSQIHHLRDVAVMEKSQGTYEWGM